MPTDRDLMPPPDPLPFLKNTWLKKNVNQPSINLKEQSNVISNSSSIVDSSVSLSDSSVSTSLSSTVSSDNIEDEFSNFLSEIDLLVKEQAPNGEKTEIINENLCKQAGVQSASSLWREVLDPKTKLLYYWNYLTNEVTWTKPDDLKSEKELLFSKQEEKNVSFSDCKVEEDMKTTNLVTYIEEKENSRKSEEEKFEINTYVNSKSAIIKENKIKKNTQLSDNSDGVEKKQGEKEQTNKSIFIHSSCINGVENKIENFLKQIDFIKEISESEAVKIELENAKQKSKKKRKTKDNVENKANNRVKSDSIDEDDTTNKNESVYEESLENIRIKKEEESYAYTDIIEGEYNKILGEEKQNDENTRDRVSYYNTRGTAAQCAQIQSMLTDIWNRLNVLIDPSYFIFRTRIEVQLETRTTDWSAGELNPSYFIKKLKEISIEVEANVLSLYSAIALQNSQSIQFSSNLLLSDIYPPAEEPSSSFLEIQNSSFLSSSDPPPPVVDPPPLPSSNISPNTEEQEAKSNKTKFEEEINKDNQFLLENNNNNDIKDNNTINNNNNTNNIYSSSSITVNTSAPVNILKKKKKQVQSANTFLQKKKLQLIDKWKKSAEVALEEERETSRMNGVFASEEERLAKEEREIEQWKEEQIVSGAAKRNANFIPLSSNWRDLLEKKILK